MGPGLWRGNPAYASNPKFQTLLSTKIEQTLFDTDMNNTQLLRGEIKAVTKQCIKSFGIKHVSCRASSMKLLERIRDRLLRPKPPLATRPLLIPKIDQMIDTLQQELVDLSALKTGNIWPSILRVFHHLFF